MLQCFAIKDLRASCFLNPFFSRNAHEATRAIQTVVNDPASNLNKFASDFSLHLVGTFDDETGVLNTPQNGSVQLVMCDQLFYQGKTNNA